LLQIISAWRVLVAGKGLGEDVTNDAAARPVVAAREGRARESPEKGETQGGDAKASLARAGAGRAVNEPSSSERATSSWSILSSTTLNASRKTTAPDGTVVQTHSELGQVMS